MQTASLGIMEYFNLVFGIGLILVFLWLLIENRKRSHILYFPIDTIIGIVVGVYLVVVSIQSLII